MFLFFLSFFGLSALTAQACFFLLSKLTLYESNNPTVSEHYVLITGTVYVFVQCAPVYTVFKFSANENVFSFVCHIPGFFDIKPNEHTVRHIPPIRISMFSV
uniref:Secreted protein n=1 Tax=Cacopsylla melanoneura TaxID=428564 RepID=A0A8D8Z7N3_9HEMI